MENPLRYVGLFCGHTTKSEDKSPASGGIQTLDLMIMKFEGKAMSYSLCTHNNLLIWNKNFKSFNHVRKYILNKKLTMFCDILLDLINSTNPLSCKHLLQKKCFESFLFLKRLHFTFLCGVSPGLFSLSERNISLWLSIDTSYKYMAKRYISHCPSLTMIVILVFSLSSLGEATFTPTGSGSFFLLLLFFLFLNLFPVCTFLEWRRRQRWGEVKTKSFGSGFTNPEQGSAIPPDNQWQE